MDSMTYKGYIATVHYSDEDRVFFGKIHGINDLVTFEGNTAKSLSTEFHNAVDDYLKTCKKIGKSPDKTFNGVFNIRTGTDLHRKAVLLAEKYHVSLNDFVKTALSYGINHENDLASQLANEPVSEYKKKK
ncbi:MAG TPA: type II toxin-antitoxin system HicB family antitoxin [Bacteroidia bacterium]|jgi:predicted HicB family RNase H-like nuclease|nr:type II toxin-antitoxin system HicB family antitoxin [Bacteroidia bacterium]